MKRNIVAWMVTAAGLAMACTFVSAAQTGASSPVLSKTELAGKKIFMQRCSLCHLPPLGRPGDAKAFGPPLNGVVKSPETEARAREIVRKGTPRMPGFQYGLQAGEIDNLIAYLKTMR